MMKHWIALGLCFVFLCVFSGCNSYTLTEEEEARREQETQIAAQFLNENSDFGDIELLQPYVGTETYVNSFIDGSDSANSVPAYGPPPEKVYDSKGNNVLRGAYGFYPRETDKMAIVEINLGSPYLGFEVSPDSPYHVMRIKPGMDLETALSTMESYGYIVQKPTGPYEILNYQQSNQRTILRNADINILIDCEEDKTTILSITAIVFDKRE